MATNNENVNLCPVCSGKDLLKIISFSLLLLFVVIVIVLVFSDIIYLFNHKVTFSDVINILSSPKILAGIKLSFITSLITLMLVLIFAVPAGYALSRYHFPGHTIINTIVDVPLILPPVVIGISLLAFFGTSAGNFIKGVLAHADLSVNSCIGIIMCQFIVAVPYCIRAAKASFDSVDRNLEHIALTLGCSNLKCFSKVTMPLARNGLIAGGVMAWARAIGVFGPLMVFIGTSPRVQVMPTSIWLELSIGNIEVSLTIAMVMLLLASIALAIVHWLAPGKNWL